MPRTAFDFVVQKRTFCAMPAMAKMAFGPCLTMTTVFGLCWPLIDYPNHECNKSNISILSKYDDQSMLNSIHHTSVRCPKMFGHGYPLRFRRSTQAAEAKLNTVFPLAKRIICPLSI